MVCRLVVRLHAAKLYVNYTPHNRKLTLFIMTQSHLLPHYTHSPPLPEMLAPIEVLPLKAIWAGGA